MWLLALRGAKQHLIEAIPNLIIFLIMSALVSIVWWQLGYKEEDLSNRTGSIISSMFPLILSLLPISYFSRFLLFFFLFSFLLFLLAFLSGLLFFVVWNAFMMPMFSALNELATERRIVRKERPSHLYRLSAYILSKTIANAPIDAMSPISKTLSSFHSPPPATTHQLCR
jgi:polyferredoxin